MIVKHKSTMVSEEQGRALERALGFADNCWYG
jgi:hypothetical protein